MLLRMPAPSTYDLGGEIGHKTSAARNIHTQSASMLFPTNSDVSGGLELLDEIIRP
jgi:hypothetical protein